MFVSRKVGQPAHPDFDIVMPKRQFRRLTRKIQADRTPPLTIGYLQKEATARPHVQQRAWRRDNL
ncbi:hypothetical protein BwSG20_52930 [Bradyrhizobium ottawaense]|nr:hypothetical protein BwSG20_52930 [Bradyrhizobium ottawaense]